MSVRNKQNWIKDILTKSGTEITEVNADKSEGDLKMVYYTSIPLVMQNDHHSSSNGEDLRSITNLSSNNRNNETQLYNISSSNMNDPKLLNAQTQSKTMITLTNVVRPQQQQPQNATPSQPISTTTNGNSSSKQQFKCDQCNMFFGSKSAHTSHMKSHNKTNGTRANASSNGNGTASNSSDPYQCDVCKKTFAVPARLVRHYRTHTGERPFECEFCHKMFSVKENLQVHRRIHTKERPYKCDRCGRAFEHSGKLHRHMRIHTGERPHKCSVCSKTFIQSGQLVIHMRTHTGEKPYKCPVEGCGKGFTCSKQLKVHSRTHTGEKPYHCDICFRDFGYNHVLKLHRVQHYGSKCYKCTICDETFKSKKEMEAHIKGHANEMPDDDQDSPEAIPRKEIETVKIENNGSHTMESTQTIRASPTSTMPTLSPSPNSSTSASTISMLPTPRESSSDAHSDADDMAYYNIFTRFDQSTSSNDYKVQSNGGGVNPALLAAVSIAASANDADDLTLLRTHAPTTSSTSSATNALLAAVTEQDASMDPSFIYEPLAVMHQQGYFNPAPRVSEYKSSIHASNDIVKRVEAALAGAEPLLTPPRSTPESPDRSSSPDSDVVMAERDVMSLPLRKRKNYPRDGQSEQSKGQSNGDEGSSSSAPIMRMSSVIQFAKAS